VVKVIKKALSIDQRVLSGFVLLILGGFCFLRGGVPLYLSVGFVVLGLLLWGNYIQTMPVYGVLTAKSPVSEKSSLDIATEVIFLLLILAMGCYLLGDAMLGHRPVNADHRAHFFRLWEVNHHLLTEGRLHGWSHRWFAGYPVGYQYPQMTYFFIALLHRFSFGILTLSQAYGIFVGFAFLSIAYALYYFGRSVFSPTVGFLAAVMQMTDRGIHPTGGWGMTMELGVWLSSFSLVFSLLAVIYFEKMIEKKRVRDLGTFSLLLGLALLCHPIQLLNMPMLLSCLLFVYVLLRRFSRIPLIVHFLMIAFVIAFLNLALWGLKIYFSVIRKFCCPAIPSRPDM